MADAFLLNPKNQAFLDGKDKIPWSARPPFWIPFSTTIFLLTLLVAVIGYFMYDLWLLRHLRANGIETTATVLNSTVHQTIEDDSGSITFRYQAHVGNERRNFTRNMRTRPETASRYLKGSRMKVVHDPADPEFVRIADELKMEPHHPEFPGDPRIFGALKLIDCRIPRQAPSVPGLCVWLGNGSCFH